MKEYTLSVIAEDSVSTRGRTLRMEAKHGLSILLKRTKPPIQVLMDTSQSPETLLRNMGLLGVSFEKTHAVFLSHGHYDHTGGLLGTLKSSDRSIPVIAHPDAFNPKFKMDPHLRSIGCPFKFFQSELSASAVLARNPVTIADGIMTTGEINRTTGYERPQGFWTVKNEAFVKDMLIDDQALVLETKDRGLVILSGCAHSGIINTVRYAQRLTGEIEVHSIIGGFHLADSSEETINATLNDLVKVNPALICPCHCTGSKSIRRLTKFFGKKCQPLRTGDVITI